MCYSELTAKTRRLLNGPLKHVRKAALATALVPLGAVGVADSATAQIFNTSRVDSTVTSTMDGYLYEFTLVNTSLTANTLSDGDVVANGVFIFPVIIDWELPLFSMTDIDVSSIQSPAGWSYEIVSGPPYTTSQDGDVWSTYDPATDPLLDPLQGGDPNLYGPNPQVFDNPPLVLHWYEDGTFSGGAGIFPGDFLTGFSFESEYSSQNAPYLASWLDMPPVGGDPPIPGSGFGSPNSPARQAAQGVPEPSAVVLLVMAGMPLAWAAGLGRPRRSENS